MKMWKDTGKRRECELCERKYGNLEHVTRECGELERGITIDEIVNEEGKDGTLD